MLKWLNYHFTWFREAFGSTAGSTVLQTGPHMHIFVHLVKKRLLSWKFANLQNRCLNVDVDKACKLIFEYANLENRVYIQFKCRNLNKKIRSQVKLFTPLTFHRCCCCHSGKWHVQCLDSVCFSEKHALEEPACLNSLSFQVVHLHCITFTMLPYSIYLTYI